MVIDPVLSFRAEHSSKIMKMLCEDSEEESRNLSLEQYEPY